MKHYVLYILLINNIIYNNSCTSPTFNIHQEELQVYKNILDSLVNIDKYYKPFIPIELLLKDSFSYERVKIKQQEFNEKVKNYYNKIDTIKKNLFIEDTLFAIHDSIDDILLSRIPEKNLEYKNILTTIPEYAKKNLPINSNDLSNNNNISIINKSFKDRNELFNSIGEKNGELFLGKIKLSRVLFNSTYTKAIFLYSFICGGTCGEESLVIVKKDKDKWIIDEKINILIF